MPGVPIANHAGSANEGGINLLSGQKGAREAENDPHIRGSADIPAIVVLSMISTDLSPERSRKTYGLIGALANQV